MIINDTDIEDQFIEQILAMREAFDNAFAVQRTAQVSAGERCVILEVGSLKVACRVEQITRLEAERKIVPLPGGTPGLVGLAGVRGKLVPVYSLGLLLNADGVGAARWLALCGGTEPIGLAFDRLERFVRAHPDDVCPLHDTASAPRHVSALLRVGTTSYNLVDVNSVVASIRAQSAGNSGTE